MVYENRENLRLGKYIQINETILLFLLNIAITFLFYINFLNESNCNYAIEELHMYNTELFNNSISVVGAEYSPRYYANVFMAAAMHIFNVDWFEAAVFMIRFNYILYAASITFLTVKIIRSRRLLAGLILNISIMSGTLISLGFELEGAANVFLGTGIPLAFIGIICIFGEKKQWFLAWIMCSLAGFMHIHEGMWSGCVVGVVWLAGCIAEHRINWKAVRGLPIYAAVICLIVFPSLLHSEPVDNHYFTWIYAFIRTPHHLLLSAWGWKKILRCGILLFIPVAILIALYRKDRDDVRRRERMAVGISMAMLWVLLLAIEYFGTEICPMPVIVTMYVPKCFKFITFMGMAAYAYLGFEHLKDKEYIKGVCLICMLLVSDPDSSNLSFAVCICLSAIYVLDWQLGVENKFFQKKGDQYHKVWGLSVYLIPMAVVVSRLYMSKSLWISIFAVAAFEFLGSLTKRKRAFTSVIVLLLTVALLAGIDGKIFDISKNGIRYINGAEFVKTASGDEIYDLAMRFREITDTDAEFLSNPMSSQANYFQLISERTCYCLYKNVPSSKKAIIQWYERVTATQMIDTYDACQLWELMEEIGIDYVLVTNDRFEILEDSGLFRDVVRSNKWGMYQLIR